MWRLPDKGLEKILYFSLFKNCVCFQLSKQAVKDYNRGRMYLSDLANREGVPVFESVAEAVECVIMKCSGR